MPFEDRIVRLKSSTAYIDSDEVTFTILFESRSRSKISSRACLRGQDHRFRFFAFNPVNSHRAGSPATSQTQQFYKIDTDGELFLPQPQNLQIRVS